MHRRTQWLIERATRAMLFWLEQAEKLSATYDRRMAEEQDRAVVAGKRPIDGQVTWAGTVEAKNLISNGVWAHRKTRSYAAVVQALSARSLVLGDSACALDVALDSQNSHRGVFDIDSTPGMQPPRKQKGRPWLSSLRGNAHGS